MAVPQFSIGADVTGDVSGRVAFSTPAAEFRLARRATLVLAALVVGGCGAAPETTDGTGSAEEAPVPPSSNMIEFATIIQPIFDQHCTACHNRTNQAAGLYRELSLESYEEVISGGVSGGPIVPGDPDNSLLMRMMSGSVAGRPRMPFDEPTYFGTVRGQLELALVEQWISEGALDVDPGTSRVEPDAGSNGFVDEGAAPDDGGSQQSGVDYATQIAPILAKCTPCHGGTAGLHFETYDSIVESAVSSLASSGMNELEPFDAESSYLVWKIEGRDGILGSPMPFGGPPLPPGEIQLIKDWIDQGILEVPAGAAPAADIAPALDAVPGVDFGTQIAHIFINCTPCHGDATVLLSKTIQNAEKRTTPQSVRSRAGRPQAGNRLAIGLLKRVGDQAGGARARVPIDTAPLSRHEVRMLADFVDQLDACERE